MRPAFRTIAIAGASLAGLRAAEALRERGFDGRLIIVGEEQQFPYRRPPLSKDVLLGRMNQADIAIDIPSDLNAEWMLGRRVCSLQRDKRQLELNTGERIAFDGLVIATGAKARRVTIPGGDLSGVLTLRTLDDALLLRDRLARAKRIAILGAGLIGCEIASVFVQLGLKPIVIDTAPLPMMRVLPSAVSRALLNRHTAAGVHFKLGVRPTAIYDEAGTMRVEIDDGTIVGADTVVCAIGADPAVQWLVGSGLRLENGLLCDEFCFALEGDRRIVGAGDVACWTCHGVGDIRIEHWTNAGEQATVAARNLLAQDQAVAYRPLLSFWTDQFGLRIQALGAPWRSDRTEVELGSLSEKKFAVSCWRGSDLVGAITSNMPAELAKLRARLAPT